MRLELYQADYWPQIQDYYFENTGNFSRQPVKAIQDLEENQIPLLLFNDDNQLVSFLVLDHGPYRDTFSDNEGALLIRSLSTATNFEGRGYARHLVDMLPDFVRDHLPQFDELVLAVNVKNDRARKIYDEAGYEDTGRIVTESTGPQNVMTLDL